MRTLDELLNALGFHPATPETAEKYDKIRKAFSTLAKEVSPLLPDGPDKTTAHRAIALASRECIASIAINQAPIDTVNPHVARVLPHGDVAIQKEVAPDLAEQLPETTCACGNSPIPAGYHTARAIGSDLIHVRKETGEECGTA